MWKIRQEHNYALFGYWKEMREKKIKRKEKKGKNIFSLHMFKLKENKEKIRVIIKWRIHLYDNRV